MRSRIVVALLIVISFSACKQEDKNKEIKTRTADLLYDRGEKISSDNFTGSAWLNSLVTADSINRNAVGSVTFEPGARTYWHSHPGGQIILALEGEGFYQEKGSGKRILKKGDVIKCPANTPHWHGASVEKEFIQVAITGREKGPTQWLQPVTVEEYNN